MYLIKVQRTIPKLKNVKVRLYSQPAIADDEYTETPQYPEILDLSLAARKLRKREAIYEKIRNLNTVEEKQIALNMPKYYGFKSVIFNENKVPFNALPLVQGFTRSHLKIADKLPEIYAETDAIASDIVKEIKGQIEDAIAMELEYVSCYKFEASLEKSEEQQLENAITNRIIKQMNRIIMNNLADKTTHIFSAQVDYEPRHEAFWFVGGVDPYKRTLNFKKKIPWLRDGANEPVDRPIQYYGTPLLALRSNQPLKPLVPHSEAENPEFAVPKFTYHAETVGYATDYKHATNIPGFWPGDTEEFGLLSIHGRGHILDREASFGEIDTIEALHCQAMKASYGWLLAQANFQGFTTFNDITYPLATQTIITNGQFWSLYAYQLNTIVMHNEHIDTNPKFNLCYGVKPQKLYEVIENGKVKGFNEDVLKMIVQLYLNAPEERDHVLKPYLNAEEMHVADIEDDNRRCWLENIYKHLVANRPRHLLRPEIYEWEKIYKIYFNTRFRDAKRRPFEFDIDPLKRRLDEHLPTYIPKALRSFPKSKKKFEPTYYPKIYD